MAVGRDGVDPRDAERLLDDLLDLAHRLGAADPQPSVRRVGVAAVGVPQGVGGLGVPGQPRLRHDHHRAVAGGVEGAGLRAGGGFDRDALAVHRMALAVHQIGGGIGRIERQFKQREVAVCRHRMGPGDVLVEPDRHAGAAGDGHAHHVELAGNGQVGLVETVGAFPGEVRIAEHQAGLVGGDFAPEGPAVGAKADHLGHVGQAKAGGRFQGRLCRGRGGGVGLAQPRASAGLDHPLLVQAQHVVDRDGSQPRLVAALGRQLVLGRVGQIAVEAGDIPIDQFAIVGRALGAPGAQIVDVGVGAEEEVAFQVLDVGEGDDGGGVWPEVLGALAIHRHDLVGEQAKVVLGEGVALAIADAAIVLGGDVGDAELSADDLRLIGRRLGAGGHARAQHQGGRRQKLHRHCVPPLARVSPQAWPGMTAD